MIVKVAELVESISQESNLKYMGESKNEKNEISFVFIDNVDELVKVAEEQIKKQNINGRIVKVIISDDEMVKKDAPICLNHNDTNSNFKPSIAYTNKDGEITTI